jgi:hypothetical protein
MLGTVWEVLALCLAAWITAKHFRELRRRPTGWDIGDCLMVLIKSHVFYFMGSVNFIVTIFLVGPEVTGILDLLQLLASAWAAGCLQMTGCADLLLAQSPLIISSELADFQWCS